MLKLKIDFAENKCLSTIGSTEMICKLLVLIQQETIIKALIFCDYNLTPT